jgi:hypothetical protein
VVSRVCRSYSKYVDELLSELLAGQGLGQSSAAAPPPAQPVRTLEVRWGGAKPTQHEKEPRLREGSGAVAWRLS